MNKTILLSFLFFIFSTLFFLFGVLNKEIEFGIVLFFPYMIGSGMFSFLGFISIFIASILLIFGIRSRIFLDELNPLNIDNNQTKNKKSVKTGGVILVGPIPIVIGSNWKITVLLIILTIILIFVSLMIFLHFNTVIL